MTTITLPTVTGISITGTPGQGQHLQSYKQTLNEARTYLSNSTSVASSAQSTNFPAASSTRMPSVTSTHTSAHMPSATFSHMPSATSTNQQSTMYANMPSVTSSHMTTPTNQQSAMSANITPTIPSTILQLAQAQPNAQESTLLEEDPKFLDMLKEI